MIQTLPVQRPARSAYAPVGCLMLYLTEDCNLRCVYCFVDKRPRRMSSETARKAVDFLLSRAVSGALYEVGINFFGGEPFLELERMEEVVAWARRPRPNTYKRVRFSATTNGTLAGPRVERLVREAGMSLLVSLDGGALASRHRPFLSGRSSYGLVARNLPKLVEWSPDLMVRMTFHPAALDLVGNLRHALELGAPRVALCPVEEAEWGPAAEALEAAYQELADWFVAEARGGRLLPLEITRRLLRRHHRWLSGGPRMGRPCGVGTHLLGVDPEGNVMPCHRFLERPQDRLGTVDEPTLAPERMQYVHLSARDILGCDTCFAEPVCGGGCRAVALGAGLGLHEAFPGHCLTFRAHARAVERIYDTLRAEGNPALEAFLEGAAPSGDALSELAHT